ncbi:MAG: hypothetical protein JOZ18_15795 [Chloroflexi bacterium]|nr:hypothetical protein [Chloroflexota bacterium]
MHFQLSLAREKKVIENVVVVAGKGFGINLTPPGGCCKFVRFAGLACEGGATGQNLQSYNLTGVSLVSSSGEKSTAKGMEGWWVE